MNRFMRFTMSGELIAEWFSAGRHELHYEVIKGALPKDTRLVNVHHRCPNSIEFLIESDEFDEVGPGQEIPEITPVLRGIEADG
jgi:hypothetical protein